MLFFRLKAVVHKIVDIYNLHMKFSAVWGISSRRLIFKNYYVINEVA